MSIFRAIAPTFLFTHFQRSLIVLSLAIPYLSERYSHIWTLHVCATLKHFFRFVCFKRSLFFQNESSKNSLYRNKLFRVQMLREHILLKVSTFPLRSALKAPVLHTATHIPVLYVRTSPPVLHFYILCPGVAFTTQLL